VENDCGAGQATDDNCACWILKATNVHTGCVIIIAFPLQQWSYKRALILRYTYIACLVTFVHISGWSIYMQCCNITHFVLQLLDNTK
jgi:hypothetical protein